MVISQFRSQFCQLPPVAQNSQFHSQICLFAIAHTNLEFIAVELPSIYFSLRSNKLGKSYGTHCVWPTSNSCFAIARNNWVRS